MPIVHHILGGLLVLLYLLVFLLSLFNESLSRRIRIFADILLFLQYIVGIILLISGLKNVHLHYIFALLPIILIPFSKKLGTKITSLLFLIFIFLAYFTGIRRGI